MTVSFPIRHVSLNDTFLHQFYKILNFNNKKARQLRRFGLEMMICDNLDVYFNLVAIQLSSVVLRI
jgi:hypothetical protein